MVTVKTLEEAPTVAEFCGEIQEAEKAIKRNQSLPLRFETLSQRYSEDIVARYFGTKRLYCEFYVDPCFSPN
jgi:hypothetical protein